MQLRAAATDRTAPRSPRGSADRRGIRGDRGVRLGLAVSGRRRSRISARRVGVADEPATAGPLLVFWRPRNPPPPRDLPVAGAGPTLGRAVARRADSRDARKIRRPLGPRTGCWGLAGGDAGPGRRSTAASAGQRADRRPLGSGKEHVAKAIHYRQAAATAAGLIPLSVTALDAEPLALDLGVALG